MIFSKQVCKATTTQGVSKDGEELIAEKKNKKNFWAASWIKWTGFKKAEIGQWGDI